jgi:hypothetical protein
VSEEHIAFIFKVEYGAKHAAANRLRPWKSRLYIHSTSKEIVLLCHKRIAIQAVVSISCFCSDGYANMAHIFTLFSHVPQSLGNLQDSKLLLKCRVNVSSTHCAIFGASCNESRSFKSQRLKIPLYAVPLCT